MIDPSRVVLNPAVLAGKPITRGTRLSVELIIGRWLDRRRHLEQLRRPIARGYSGLLSVRTRSSEIGKNLSRRRVIRFPVNENISDAAIGRLKEDRARRGLDSLGSGR